MGAFLKVILRFGPLVAAFALGLGAVLEPFVPGYTGIVSAVLAGLGLVDIGPDQDVLALFNTFVAGVIALIGVARKLISMVKGKAAPPVEPVA